MTKKAKDVMEEALHALVSVKKDWEFQALHGGPHFTSAQSEREEKMASCRDTERKVNRAVKLLREELEG